MAHPHCSELMDFYSCIVLYHNVRFLFIDHIREENQKNLPKKQRLIPHRSCSSMLLGQQNKRLIVRVFLQFLNSV